MNMHHIIISAMIFLVIVFGAIECFFGYRIFKIILGIIGFFVGGAMAIVAGNSVFRNEIILFLISLTGGIIGAMMMVWLYFFGVFIIGALLGGVAGSALLATAQIYPGTFILLIISIGCGVLALVFQKFMIILATAFIGSWHMVAGAICFLSGTNCLTNMEWWFKPVGIHNYIMTLMWLFFGFLGFFVQYKLISVEDRPLKSNL